MAVWNIAYVSELKGSIRLDAEFWRPEFTLNEKSITAIRHNTLGNLVEVFRKGIFYILAREYRSNGIPFYRSSDVGHILPNDDEVVFISEAKNREEIKTSLTYGDIMIAKTGKHAASVVFSQICNVSQDVIAVKVNDGINSFYLSVFLNTKYGELEMNRWFQGQVQPHISLPDAKKILVPIPSKEFQSEIQKIVINSYKAREISKSLYTQARQLLENELGLDKLDYKSISYEASFSEVMEGKRIDAQCYKPEYVNYEYYLRENCKFDYLRSLLSSTLKGKQMRVLASGDIFYASIKDIQFTEIITDSYCTLNSETRVAQRKDLLLAITGATIGKIGLINRYDNLAFCGDLLRLKTNGNIDPYYLLAVMQSSIGQSQCQRWITGSTNGHLSPIDVGKIVIPRLSEGSEIKIAGYIKNSIEAKYESEQLIEQAKRRVGELVEQAVEP